MQYFVLDDFVKSFAACVLGAQNDFLRQALETLTQDPMISEADILRFCIKENCLKDDVAKTFSKLSSGHKIILLTVTKLVEKVRATWLLAVVDKTCDRNRLLALNVLIWCKK